MVNAARSNTSQDAYRRGHQFGNRLFTRLVSGLFGKRFNDILSGYRVFSRRFVKSFPALAKGFEIETEERTRAVQGKSVSVRVDLEGRRIIKKKNNNYNK